MLNNNMMTSTFNFLEEYKPESDMISMDDVR